MVSAALTHWLPHPNTMGPSKSKFGICQAAFLLILFLGISKTVVMTTPAACQGNFYKRKQSSVLKDHWVVSFCVKSRLSPSSFWLQAPGLRRLKRSLNICLPKKFSGLSASIGVAVDPPIFTLMHYAKT